MQPKPENPVAHAFLTANGYTYTFMDTFEDDGDAESGPHLVGGQWDEYESAEDTGRREEGQEAQGCHPDARHVL